MNYTGILYANIEYIFYYPIMKYSELIKELRIHRKEREWDNLAPLDLALSIVLESSELLEQFQWDMTDIKDGKTIRDKNIQKISDEVGDIMIYLTGFCDVLGIDLLKATKDKLAKVKEKYPVEKLKDEGFYSSQKAKFRENK